jgi:hypothetical protein
MFTSREMCMKKPHIIFCSNCPHAAGLVRQPRL